MNKLRVFMKRSLLPRAAQIGVIIHTRVIGWSSVVVLDQFFHFFPLGFEALCGSLGLRPGYVRHNYHSLLFYLCSPTIHDYI